jgi:glutathione S-transferase
MKLIGVYLSPFTRRVAAALVSRSIPYEHVELNGYVDPDRARQLNPVGKVPVLVLDDGEHLIDSGAILDYLNEYAGPAHALIPSDGAPRRLALRLAAIATTIYEQSTARHFEAQRPAECVDPALLERYRLQTIGGLQELDRFSIPNGPIGALPLDIATISAVVAFDYAGLTHPDLDSAAIAPALAKAAAALRENAAFANTRPR